MGAHLQMQVPPRVGHSESRDAPLREYVVQQVAGNGHRCWRNSNGLVKTALTIGSLALLGLPRLIGNTDRP
jgi:hypothetical protein